MKNTFGNNITLTLFGESHGQAIGVVLDGVCAGIKIDEEYINNKLNLRKPFGSISTSRVEKDQFKIVSGVFNGYTTGSPICVVIENCDTHSCDYEQLKNTPRPSHADYTASVKYNGFNDYRGGGHFSGRLTAPIVCALAIIQKALEDKGIFIGSHVSFMQGIKDKDIKDVSDIQKLNQMQFAVLDEDAKSQMIGLIEDIAKQGDSVGGILETCVIGVPAGVGEPWFDTLEGVLSHAIFSIPAVKGIEFGLGFGFSQGSGSQLNDCLAYVDGKIKTKTNNNGGINGGISNGEQIIFRSAIKPTPSIYKPQQTLNLSSLKQEELQIKGRHDPAIIHRARVVVDSLTALVVADMLVTKFGTDYLVK